MNVSTEIRSFYSIKEITTILDEEIEGWKSTVDEYSQWLGSFLRDSETTESNQEWRGRMEQLGKKQGRRPPKKTKKGGKPRKVRASTEWIQFKDVMLSASEHCEAEILFDAIEEIGQRIERLEKVKSSLEHLEESGLGKDITYIAYFSNGVPEKIVLRHNKDQEFSEKFQYVADFSIQRQS